MIRRKHRSEIILRIVRSSEHIFQIIRRLLELHVNPEYFLSVIDLIPVNFQDLKLIVDHFRTVALPFLPDLGKISLLDHRISYLPDAYTR